MVEQVIGGVQGSGGTGLQTGTFTGDSNADRLILGPTNGASNRSGATGYKVVIEEGAAGLSGTVSYVNVVDGPVVTFAGFEQFSFTSLAPVAANNGDVVDATEVTSNLTLDTGAGNDTVDFGGGDDTFVIGNRKFGADVVDGGAGIDTLDLSALTGAQRSPFTFKGTNLFQTTALVVERTDEPANKVTFTNFEVIRSGGDHDVFTSGYAPQTLERVEMGGGNDQFGWLIFNNDELDIDAGANDDLVTIGGNSGSGRTGLHNGTVAGGSGVDRLALGGTNGHSGATGFKVVIEDDLASSNAFKGVVQYTDGATDGLGDTEVDFSGFEAFTFSGQTRAQNNDHVDATLATRNLTLNTGAGDDTVNFGSGKDTFVIGSRTFGADVTDGGAGVDTLDLSAVSGAQRSPFTFKGTNLFQTTALVVERTDATANKVTFTNFEAIRSGGDHDVFTSGYAAKTLNSIDMGAGNDRFEWITLNGDKLDIVAGSGNDTIAIGGAQGVGASGLINGEVDGGAGVDTLLLRFNNTEGASGNGFRVLFDDQNNGEVSYRGGEESGPTTSFTGIERIVFDGFHRRNDLDDVVDAEQAKIGLTINTAAGNDTIIAGRGNDVLTGGRGMDKFVFTDVSTRFGSKDVITDFNVLEDKIALDGDVAVTNVQTLNGGTFITTTDGWITLNGVTGLDTNNIASIVSDYIA